MSIWHLIKVCIFFFHFPIDIIVNLLNIMSEIMMTLAYTIESIPRNMTAFIKVRDDLLPIICLRICAAATLIR